MSTQAGRRRQRRPSRAPRPPTSSVARPHPRAGRRAAGSPEAPTTSSTAGRAAGEHHRDVGPGGVDGVDPLRRRRRRALQGGDDHEALRCGEAGVAGGEREAVVGRGRQHVDLLGAHHGDPLHLVAEGALHGGHEDRVAGLQLVEAEEGGAVGGAVAGDGGVAGLAGQRGAGVVARALAQVGQADALDHRLVDPDPGDQDAGRRPGPRGPAAAPVRRWAGSRRALWAAVRAPRSRRGGGPGCGPRRCWCRGARRPRNRGSPGRARSGCVR